MWLWNRGSRDAQTLNEQRSNSISIGVWMMESRRSWRFDEFFVVVVHADDIGNGSIRTVNA